MKPWAGIGNYSMYEYSCYIELSMLPEKVAQVKHFPLWYVSTLS